MTTPEAIGKLLSTLSPNDLVDALWEWYEPNSRCLRSCDAKESRRRVRCIVKAMHTRLPAEGYHRLAAFLRAVTPEPDDG